MQFIYYMGLLVDIHYNMIDHNELEIKHYQGRIGPAAPPPLRAVGPWLNHAFFYELIIYVVKHI